MGDDHPVELALLLVSMAAVVLAATAVSDRLRVPAPLLLVVVGAAASYVPGVPTIHLESEVVLLGLLPPLLYAAAIQTSLVDFNANRGSILRLSVVLVVLTALAVVLVLGAGFAVEGVGIAALLAEWAAAVGGLWVAARTARSMGAYAPKADAIDRAKLRRSLVINTTFQASPSRCIARITQPPGSASHQRSPCSAERGKAWWLWCHASPNDRGASHATLRDSSVVRNRRRPRTWHRELIANVTWCSRKIRTTPPHSSAVSAASSVPPSSQPSANGTTSPSPTHQKNSRSIVTMVRSRRRSGA